MADINTYLFQLSNNLKLLSSYRDRIDISIEYFKQKIWGYFQDRLLEVVVFGSYSRNTIISVGEVDVDIVAIYRTKEFQPDTYLKQIKAFCEITYPRSTIHQDHPTIVINMDHIKFEIVPSYYVSTGVIKIPAPQSKELKWINTNPKDLMNRILSKDRNNKNLIIPVIRIFKYWNILNQRPFSSFQIERSIADKSFSCLTLKDYFVSSISAIEEIASNDAQKKAIMKLKDKQRRLRILETHNLNEYIEQELNSFLPFPPEQNVLK